MAIWHIKPDCKAKDVDLEVCGPLRATTQVGAIWRAAPAFVAVGEMVGAIRQTEATKKKGLRAFLR